MKKTKVRRLTLQRETLLALERSLAPAGAGSWVYSCNPGTSCTCDTPCETNTCRA
jgi:hypothetical protein